MHPRLLRLIALVFAVASLSAAAQEAAPEPASAPEPAATDGAAEATPAPEAPAAPAPKRIAVIMPEQIDGEWYWFDYGGGHQHLVQNAFEKAIVSAGFEVIDVANIGGRISIDDLIQPKTAAAKGADLGADYVVVGKATAAKSSEGSAYGVNVVRANAEITVRLVRVSDGKVLAVDDANALAGGQATKAAGQAALKQAGQDAARKMVRALRQQVPQP
jgi:pyruvate/2-oxoglutarate dehydrogenase complex dihydrolipoamide acyltransferase (E2) component